MIHGAPEVMCFAVDLRVNLIQMIAPMRQRPHSLYPFPADLGSEHRAKPNPPEPHRFMAHINAALV